MLRTGLLLRVVPAVLFAAVLALPVRAAPEPPQPPMMPKPSEEGDIEIRCVDDSIMRLKLLDDKLELVTKHGVLRIATAEIRKIEFATRVPADIAEKVAKAISKLNDSDFKVREAATEELKGYRARAYPQVLKASKSDDPETNRRAEEIITHIKNKVPSELLEVREFDVVHTDDSKITGKLTAEYLKVDTFQFGEQKLKLHTAFALRPAGTREVEVVAAANAPTSMVNYANQFGKEFVFTVTAAPANQFSSVWGDGQYTLDSHIQTAIVHAGFAKPGQTVTVKIRVVAPPGAFGGTTKNGVTTTAYGPYPSGAYEFVKVK